MNIKRVVLLAAGIACSSIMHAATVELTDGRQYQADIIEETERFYSLRINGMAVQIPRTMIAAIDDRSVDVQPVAANDAQPTPENTGQVVVVGSALPQPAPVSTQKAEREPISVSYEPAAEQPRVVLPWPADPLEVNRLQDALGMLHSDDPSFYIAARQTFAQAGDAGLAVLARHGLYHESPRVRTQAALVLGELGGVSVLGVLIQAFYAAAHPTISPYQVDFIQTLTAQISRLSGRDFSFQPREGNAAPQVARMMVQWWRENYAQMPRQLGEPRLISGDADYALHLWSMRNLPLERRQFAGFSLPADLVQPALPQTPAEGDFAATIPLIPRDLDLERSVSTSLTPATERPAPTLDTPGDRRRERYIERMESALEDLAPVDAR